jgi:hypothetical protein
MKWWMRDRTRDTSATSKAEEAFSGGPASAYYSNNTSKGGIYGRTRKILSVVSLIWTIKKTEW